MTEERREPAGSGQSRLERWELALYIVLLAYFAVRVTFLALRLHPVVPPDEVTHIGRILAYASGLGVPDNGPATYQYGLVDQRPWLYYWLGARVIALNVFALPDLVFLRLANAVLGLATVGVGIAWMRLWCSNPISRVLFAVMLTNTLMFTGLSGAVSYDNLANLLAAGAVYTLTHFRIRRSASVLLAFGAIVFAGCLAKRTFLPLGFLLVLLLFVRERRQLSVLPAQARALLGRPSARTLALAACAFVLGIFVVSLYGGNLLRYSKLRPGFEQVVGEEAAMQNRVYARSRIVERFRNREIGFDQAVKLAGKIRHKGDRGDTVFLLKASRLPASSLVGPVAYASEWVQMMLKSSVGYLGHRRAAKTHNAMLGYFALFGLAGILAIRGWRRTQASGVPGDAAVLVLGYASVLMWLVNYPEYLVAKYIELAVQGRYLFPVLLPFYGLVAFYAIEPLPRRLQAWVAAAASGFYLWGDLPWLLTRMDERWFMPASL